MVGWEKLIEWRHPQKIIKGGSFDGEIKRKCKQNKRS